MTATASLAAVKTLISAGFGCITFIRSVFLPSARFRVNAFSRGLLSDDNFDDGKPRIHCSSMVVSELMCCLFCVSAATLTGSRDSNAAGGSQTTSNSGKVKTVKRNFSTEADRLLDYLVSPWLRA
jgi:hypothetical protein